MAPSKLLSDMLCHFHSSFDQYAYGASGCLNDRGITPSYKKEVYHLHSVDCLASQGVSLGKIGFSAIYYSKQPAHSKKDSKYSEKASFQEHAPEEKP